MAARITTDGMWRVSYGELNGLSRDEAVTLYQQANIPVDRTATYEVRSHAPWTPQTRRL